MPHQWAKPRPDGSQPGNRRDLWGWCDVLAIGHGHTLAVQCTSAGNMASRQRKILGREKAPATATEKEREKIAAGNIYHRNAFIECLRAEWVVAVYGWDRNKYKDEPRVRYMGAEDL